MIIGLGHKARQGKDIVASIIETHSNGLIEILHFADSLKEEVSTVGPPLVIQEKVGSVTYYLLRNTDKTYDIFSHKEMPELHKLFINRNITKYKRMDSKDSELLQIWGTNYRRKYYGDDYWIRRLSSKITDSTKHYLIPDTRFSNEYKFIKDHQGLYIRVVRLNKDGTQYLDPHRDPNHPSETSLDGMKPDIDITAYTGDLLKLKEEAIKVAELIKGV